MFVAAQSADSAFYLVIGLAGTGKMKSVAETGQE